MAPESISEARYARGLINATAAAEQHHARFPVMHLSALTPFTNLSGRLRHFATGIPPHY
jgi:hypothetical protein